MRRVGGWVGVCVTVCVLLCVYNPSTCVYVSGTWVHMPLVSICY